MRQEYLETIRITTGISERRDSDVLEVDKSLIFIQLIIWLVCSLLKSKLSQLKNTKPLRIIFRSLFYHYCRVFQRRIAVAQESLTEPFQFQP